MTVDRLYSATIRWTTSSMRFKLAWDKKNIMLELYALYVIVRCCLRCLTEISDKIASRTVSAYLGLREA